MGAMCRSDPKVPDSTIATQQAGGSCSSWEVEPQPPGVNQDGFVTETTKRVAEGGYLKSQPYCNEVNSKQKSNWKKTKVTSVKITSQELEWRSQTQQLTYKSDAKQLKQQRAGFQSCCPEFVWSLLGKSQCFEIALSTSVFNGQRTWRFSSVRKWLCQESCPLGPARVSMVFCKWHIACGGWDAKVCIWYGVTSKIAAACVRWIRSCKKQTSRTSLQAWAAYILGSHWSTYQNSRWAKLSQEVSLSPKQVHRMGCTLTVLQMKEEPVHYWRVPLPDRGTWAECTS